MSWPGVRTQANKPTGGGPGELDQTFMTMLVIADWSIRPESTRSRERTPTLTHSGHWAALSRWLHGDGAQAVLGRHARMYDEGAQRSACRLAVSVSSH